MVDERAQLLVHALFAVEPLAIRLGFHPQGGRRSPGGASRKTLPPATGEADCTRAGGVRQGGGVDSAAQIDYAVSRRSPPRHPGGEAARVPRRAGLLQGSGSPAPAKDWGLISNDRRARPGSPSPRSRWRSSRPSSDAPMTRIGVVLIVRLLPILKRLALLLRRAPRSSASALPNRRGRRPSPPRSPRLRRPRPPHPPRRLYHRRNGSSPDTEPPQGARIG